MSSPFCTRRSLALGAAITALVNTGIAAVLWMSGRGPFDVQLVYAQGIGLSIWALVNGGAVWLARPGDPGGFPRGARAWVLVAGATLSGIAIGTALGDRYAGLSTLELTQKNPALYGKLLAMSMGVAMAMTLFFYLRGHSNYLEGELQRTQRQTTEAHLALLQSQLEPHMLFNTLANLRVLIGLDPERAQAMLDHLIAYLRATLGASRNAQGSHPLAVEFDRLRDYLELMAIRMGPRLSYTLDLPDDLQSVPVAPLLLQPVVENAIQHGLEPQVEGGHIAVSARQTHGQLVLQVTDTGRGLPSQPNPSRREGTPTETAHTSGPHMGFGLTHLRERLATRYGPNAHLTLSAHWPSGTTVTLHCPLLAHDD